VKESTKTAPVRKPHPDFPLTPHPSGRWCKKVKGTLYYFGKTAGDENGDAALAEWLRVEDDLLAGRKPREKRDGLTLVDAVNRFLTAKHTAVQSGELAQRSWNDYKQSCGRLLEQFGRTRIVEDMQPRDFEELKSAIAKGRNLTTLGNEIQRVRCFFKYLYDCDLIRSPVKTGPGFKRPDKRSRRRLRNARQPLCFTPDEIHRMLAAATPSLKGMILLAINCGMGNHDLATLPVHKMDLDRGWHTFGRPKTGVERRCPLWPETVEALRIVLASRHKPRDESDADLVFLTRNGRPYVRLQAQGDAVEGEQTTWNDAISRETGKLLRELGIHRKGLNFYSLRRTFRSIADGSGDQIATAFIMGHADGDSDMGATYRQFISDERLLAVVAHVRRWLFPTNAK
jgi:integrase